MPWPERLRAAAAAGAVEIFDRAPDEPCQAALHRRELLAPGDWFNGPALVVEAQTTTVVTSDFSGVVNAQGHLVLVSHG